MDSPQLHDSRLVRWLYLGAGTVALLLGLIGALLPVLPTTPFVLLAAACFARGSIHIHDWLLRNRLAGPIIREWQEYRAMDRRVKRWAFLLMGVSFTGSILMMPSSWHRLMLLGLAIVAGITLWRVPVRPLEQPEAPKRQDT
ncbi:hypothetical protein B9N43_05820 [Denitratisoma sp. DHT3]|uniref:YbaN family protein n=1 Tax=Denitratisoma sp. DHT3 TaxID=1981880 RepID=UPI001198B563|nr:YbaN family protein [Denitratisoma sp. DHT3]QDX80801.1 hypothetical protein B9N43_05820 [Denitratisoma sp. DHT3]